MTLGLLLAACGSDDDYGEILAQGSGPANSLPLWPLAEGRVGGAQGRPLVVGQRATDEGRELSIDLLPFHPDLRFPDKRTLQLLQTKAGDLIAIEDHGPRYLLLPRRVRVGMCWRVLAPFPAGAFASVLGGDVEAGDGVWTFEVRRRQVRPGPWGDQVVWTIDALGPKVPHVPSVIDDDVVDLVKGLDPSKLSAPLSSVPRWSRTMEFVEGVGPTSSFRTLAGAPVKLAGPITEAQLVKGQATATPAGSEVPIPMAPGALPPPPPAPIAGATPQSAPTLAMKALHSGPLPLELEGAFFPGTARHTSAAPERSAGHADELLLTGGVTANEAGPLDPNGAANHEYLSWPATLRLALDPVTLAVTTLDELPPLPPLPGQAPEAHPYVRADGTRWRRVDGQRIAGKLGNGVVGTAMTHAIAAEAPLLRDGNSYALSCGFERFLQPYTAVGAGRFAQCALLGFADPDDARVWAPQGASQQSEINALQVWRHATAQAPFVGAATSNSLSAPSQYVDGPPISDLPFAVDFGDVLAYVSVDAPSFGYPDATSHGAPAAGAQWHALDGSVLRRELLPLWHPGLSTRDGKQLAADISPQGELRVLHVHRDGLEVELRGRVALPAGHRAIHAAEVRDGVFVVLTEANPSGAAGAVIRAPTGIGGFDSNVSIYGIQPTRSRRTPQLFAFRVDAKAPAKRVVDRAWLLQRPTAQAAGLAVRVCEPPPPAAAPDAKVEVDRLWIAGRDIALPAERGADGCRIVAATPAEAAASVESGMLHVALHVVGHGWVERTLPPLSKPTAPKGDFALLPNGWRRYTTSLVAPLGAEVWPAPRRVPGLNPGCGSPASPQYGQCAFHIDADPSTAGAGTPDQQGRGLYALAQPPWSTLIGSLSICATPPCLDLLALSAEPAGYDPLSKPWVLLGADAVRSMWSSELATAKLPGGGVPAVGAGATVDLAAVPWINVEAARQGGRFVGPIVDPDGSRWWSVGPPVAQWARQQGATLRSGPLPAGAEAFWGVTGETVDWEPGLRTALAPLLASSTCLPQPEACNGFDDDCDGATDDDDPDRKLCDDAHGANACVAGACKLGACYGGWDDCNGDAVDGCEAALGNVAHCLACDDACPAIGGSACAKAGCTQAALAQLGVYGGKPWRRFGNGDLALDDAAAATGIAAMAGSANHVCRLDNAGAIACECLLDGPGCAGAGVFSPTQPTMFAGLGKLDRVWSGPNSSCVRVAAGGAVYCAGATVSEAPGSAVAQAAVEVPELQGADTIAFGGPNAYGAYALVAGKVVAFGPVYAGRVPKLTFTTLQGLPTVDGLYAAPGYALFSKGAEVWAVGALGKFAALGGPSTPVWSAPTRAPWLDDAKAIVTGFHSAPCKLAADRVLCPIEPGNPWNLSAYTFDEPATIVGGSTIEIPGKFQLGAGVGAKLCLVRDDLPSSVVCCGG